MRMTPTVPMAACRGRSACQKRLRTRALHLAARHSAQGEQIAQTAMRMWTTTPMVEGPGRSVLRELKVEAKRRVGVDPRRSPSRQLAKTASRLIQSRRRPATAATLFMHDPSQRPPGLGLRV
jgi:hypothetical protein